MDKKLKQITNEAFVAVASGNYCINKVTCTCLVCGAEFDEYLSATYELVGFQCSDHCTRYLPSYGKGGYLDLLPRLVPEWRPNEAITARVSREFVARLSELCPYKLSLFHRALIRCPHCTSEKVRINGEEILHNPRVQWIEIPTTLYEAL